VILTQFGLILNALLNISLIMQHPVENGVLNFLIVFFFKKIIIEKLY